MWFKSGEMFEGKNLDITKWYKLGISWKGAHPFSWYTTNCKGYIQRNKCHCSSSHKFQSVHIQCCHKGITVYKARLRWPNKAFLSDGYGLWKGVNRHPFRANLHLRLCQRRIRKKSAVLCFNFKDLQWDYLNPP